jgi:hypothetical protein
MGRIAGIVIVTAVLAALAPGQFGGKHRDGPLRWQAPARSSAVAGTTADHLLFGRVVNHSDHAVRLRAADVHVLDTHGDRLRTRAAYADGYVPGLTLQGDGTDDYGAAAGAPLGREVVLKTGASAPLSVSFTAADGKRAAAIEYGGGRLKLK